MSESEDQKVIAEVIQKTLSDPSFRKDLLASPKTVIEKMRGKRISQDIKIVEDTARVRHIVIPHAGHIEVETLSRTDIEKITSIGLRACRCATLRSS